MDFVSENLKNRNFVTFMDGFMDFVSENEKTGSLSHLWMVSWMVMCVDYLMFLWIIESNGGRSMTLPSCCCSMQKSRSMLILLFKPDVMIRK